MFLFLHSQEGKKCFHDCAKIILRIAGVFSAIRNKSSRATVFTIPVFRLPSRRWPRTSRRGGSPATAAAMIITSWVGMSRPWTAPIQMPPKHFQQNFMDDRLVALIKIDDEGKKAARARAIPQPGKTARSALSQIRRGPYELRSICARSSAIEPNLTVPSGSLASIEPSV